MAESAGTDPAASFTAHEAGIDNAIQAFETCDPPDNRALADFIERHAARLTASQRQAIHRLHIAAISSLSDRWSSAVMPSSAPIRSGPRTGQVTSRWMA